jgi:nicotinate-nucleotide adenylyltransferase
MLGDVAHEQLGLDRVVFIPAGQPWRKAGRRIAPTEDRMAMLRLAIEENPAFESSDLELSHPGPSYTADTLASLQQESPGAELFFILGHDALADLPNWHDPGRVFELATLAVAARDRDDPVSEDAMATAGVPGRVVKLSMPVIDISASDIRSRVAAGRSIHYRVPPAVEDYIRQRNLYRD